MKQKKSYDSIQYIAQEFQYALKRMIQKRTGGEITIEHFHIPKSSENFESEILSYKIFGMQTEMTISRNEEGYFMVQEIEFEKIKNSKKRLEKNLKLKRSKQGRLSRRHMNNLANQTLVNIKKFYRDSKH